ncbi:MAG: carbohydrate ABC transporter permease [Candidatus Omnitrophica bacterium]|nr:carbohydrate ABC transporter permease [Candidatus Omnitrophota bacterium]
MFINTVIHSFLIFVGLICIFPLLWMLASALKTQQTVFKDMSLLVNSPCWSNFYIAWTKGNFSMYFFNSVLYALSVVFGIVFISSLAAYAFSRLKFPGKNFIFYMFLAAMMIPLPGSFVPLYVLLVKLGLANTRTGYIFSMINVGLALSIYLLKTFFDKLPRDLEDSARIDGCGRLRIWWNVALPMAKPAIAVVTIFNTLNVWNEYILALIILQSKSIMPLQKGLMVFQGAHFTEYPVLMAGITITIIPIVFIYLFMQKFIIKGLTAEVLLG